MIEEEAENEENGMFDLSRMVVDCRGLRYIPLDRGGSVSIPQLESKAGLDSCP